MLSRTFTRSLYTSSQHVLMIDRSLKLPFLTSKETGALDIIAPGPATAKEFNKVYRQGKTGQMLCQLENNPHCTLDFANPPNLGRFWPHIYDAFVYYDDQMLFNPAGGRMSTLEIRHKFKQVFFWGVFGFQRVPKEIQIILRNKDDKLFKEWMFDEIANDVSPLLEQLGEEKVVLKEEIVSKGHKKKHKGFGTELVVRTYCHNGKSWTI